MDVKLPDGTVVQNVPEGTTQTELLARVGKFRGQETGPTSAQKLQSSLPMRMIQGMRDPIDAGAQILSRVVPDSVTDLLDHYPAKMRASSNPLVSSFANAYLADPRPQAIDKSISENERNYQGARNATAPATLETLVSGKREPGFDFARLAGNVASPANAALARLIPGGAMSTAPRMAGTGAVLGGAGGALTPVSDEAKQQEFLKNKAIQTGGGAAAGAVLTPIFGKALQAAAPHVERAIDAVTGRAGERAAQASMQTDSIISQALKDIGQTIDDIPAAQYKILRDQVNNAIKSGKKLDAAALLRKGDFEAAGLPYTQGQITRDPSQFARERNLRGVAGVGEPLEAIFTGQNQALQQNIGAYARGASDKVTAGERLAAALQKADESIKSKVNSAYGLARDSLGRAAPMDSAEFSARANLALDEGMLGHYLTPEVRAILNDVTAGKTPFNVNTAVQIDSVLSAAQRSAGQSSPQALAIGKVRDALNAAPIADNVGQDAKALFDAARSAAKGRFALHDAIPALKAAANGEVPADDFVRKFVLNGTAAETKRLASMLSKTDPAAFQEARSQLGAALQRAAFGENLAGDKLLSPERLAKALRDIGPQKLSAFFNNAEVESIKRMARVGAYINSTPAAAAVNTSNTAGAAANLATQLPGVGNKIRMLAALTQPVANQMSVRAAVNPTVPATANVSPEAIRRAQLVSAMGALGFGNVAGAVGQ